MHSARRKKREMDGDEKEGGEKGDEEEGMREDEEGRSKEKANR